MRHPLVFAFWATFAFASPIETRASCGDPAQAVPFLRGYNGADHFYTTDESELSRATSYTREDINLALVFTTQLPSSIPLYRLFNGDHFYTTDAEERDRAIAAAGFQDEGIAAYVYKDTQCGGVPFYRLFSGKVNDHFYTTSREEADRAVGNLNEYQDEGARFFVVSKDSPVPEDPNPPASLPPTSTLSETPQTEQPQQTPSSSLTLDAPRTEGSASPLASTAETAPEQQSTTIASLRTTSGSVAATNSQSLGTASGQSPAATESASGAAVAGDGDALTSSSGKKTSVLAITLGVVCGIVAILIGAIVVFWCRRRRRTAATTKAASTPFDAVPSSHNPVNPSMARPMSELLPNRLGTEPSASPVPTSTTGGFYGRSPSPPMSQSGTNSLRPSHAVSSSMDTSAGGSAAAASALVPSSAYPVDRKSVIPSYMRHSEAPPAYEAA